jgi:hypothetical protein
MQASIHDKTDEQLNVVRRPARSFYDVHKMDERLEMASVRPCVFHTANGMKVGMLLGVCVYILCEF